MNKRVYDSNILLYKYGLIIENFGNASSREGDTCFIKPSGVDYISFKKEQVVSVNILNNSYIGSLKPSTDTQTHLKLYNSYKDIGGIVHTHSTYATAWAQAGIPIPCYGTTHADYWKDEIPITMPLKDFQIEGEYELETGNVIVETLKKINLNPLECPGIIVYQHGPFSWGRSVEEAVKHANILEYIAKMAWLTAQINPSADKINTSLHKKHFSRKHGPSAYYGQSKI